MSRLLRKGDGLPLRRRHLRGGRQSPLNGAKRDRVLLLPHLLKAHQQVACGGRGSPQKEAFEADPTSFELGNVALCPRTLRRPLDLIESLFRGLGKEDPEAGPRQRNADLGLPRQGESSGMGLSHAEILPEKQHLIEGRSGKGQAKESRDNPLLGKTGPHERGKALAAVNMA